MQSIATEALHEQSSQFFSLFVVCHKNTHRSNILFDMILTVCWMSSDNCTLCVHMLAIVYKIMLNETYRCYQHIELDDSSMYFTYKIFSLCCIICLHTYRLFSPFWQLQHRANTIYSIKVTVCRLICVIASDSPNFTFRIVRWILFIYCLLFLFWFHSTFHWFTWFNFSLLSILYFQFWPFQQIDFEYISSY